MFSLVSSGTAFGSESSHQVLGLPGELEPRRRNDQGYAGGEQGVSGQGACGYQDG
jgi:hypothetical protein